MTNLFTEFLAMSTFDGMMTSIFITIFLFLQIYIHPPQNTRSIAIHVIMAVLWASGLHWGVVKLSKSRDAQDAYMRSLYQSCLDDGRPAYECRAIVYYPGGRR